MKIISIKNKINEFLKDFTSSPERWHEKLN